jgi:hypothetical protein
MFGLWAAARPWKPIPLNSRRTVMVLAGQFVALRNSRVIVSLDVWWISQSTCFIARRSLSIIKRSLPGRGFVVVVPSRFHFTITSPTVYLGNLRRVAMSLTDFFLMWQPITGPCSKALNSPDLSVLLILLRATQSQSHVTTDGQSVGLSWCRAPSGAHNQILIVFWKLQSCQLGAPSLTRGRVRHLS